MSKVFEPISIKSMTLKNRIMMLPMHLAMDLRSQQARAFYRARAEGGVGGMMTAAVPIPRFILDERWGEQYHVPSFLAGLRSLAQGVHGAGAKIGVQLLQTNQYFDRSRPPADNHERAQGEWVAPSALVEPARPVHAVAGGGGQDLRELRREEIEDIASGFAQAAASVKECGFDFVEFHSCHGTLPSQFFSPFDNHRRDEYGGDLEGRMRFGLEGVTRMRAAVGPDFPIFFRIPAVDDCPGGIALEDSQAFAAELEKAGVDCLDVAVGISVNRPRIVYISPSRNQPMGARADLARAMKEVVRVPVIASGRINTPEVAESILNEGKADLVGIGRQLLADPAWPQKVMEGRAKEIVACDSCNRNCWRHHPEIRLPEGTPLCKVNPQAGREWETAAQER